MDITAIFGEATTGFNLASAFSLANILRVLFTILVGVIVIRIIMNIVDKMLSRSSSMNAIGKYIRSVIRIALWFVLCLIVAEGLGINTTSLIAMFSVAGLAVSLALQNTLANLAGGVMLLVSKPIEVGDYVQADGMEGTVEAVGLAYTTLATVDNKEIFIPNSQISSTKIINYTRLGSRRVDLTFSASYNAPTENVRAAIMEAVGKFSQVKADPAPVVLLTKYGSSSIEYTLRAWVDGSDYWDVYFGVQEGVRESFRRNGVEMTYEHLNVHVVEK